MRRFSRFIVHRPAFFAIMAVASVVLGLIFIVNTSQINMRDLERQFSDEPVESRPDSEASEGGIDLPYSSRYDDGNDDNQDFNRDGTHILLNAVLLSAVAGAAMHFLPANYQRASGVVRLATVEAGIAGFLTMGAATLLTFLYIVLSALTLGLLCLALPLVGVAWGALTIALIVGWMVVGYPLGAEIARRFNVKASTPVIAALGTFVLTTGHGLLEMIPLIGLLATLVLVAVGSVGLGSLILTRFGRRRYPEIIELKRKNEALIS